MSSTIDNEPLTSEAEFWDQWFKDMGEMAARAEFEEELADVPPLLMQQTGLEEPASPPSFLSDQAAEHDLDAVEAAGEADPEEEEEENEPFYATLEEWVNHFFLAVFNRHEGGEFRWCRQWWRHSEAILRLDSLWRTWESLRLDDQMGMSTWLRDHLDHQLPMLMGQAGPFRQCGAKHRESTPLDAEFAPDGWWDEEE